MFTALACHAGCEVALAGRGPRLAVGQKLGAKHVIEIPPQTSLVEAISSRFDAVIEAVGKPETWSCYHLVRKGGKVNFFRRLPRRLDRFS